MTAASQKIPQLRPYQGDLVESVRQAYRAGHRCPLVVLSTGGGKTMIFSHITHNASKRDNAVLVVAHRRELIAQISMSLARFEVPHSIIAPDSAIREIKIAHHRAFGRSYVVSGSSTMIGSVQTVVRRFGVIDSALDRLAAKTGKAPQFLIIMDEAHHVVADTQWGKVMQQYPQARGLKVTATPERLDGKGLGAGVGGFADALIHGPSMSWLIEQGFLSPYRAFTTSNPVDLAGIKIRMGDFAKDELEERVDKPSIMGDAVQHYRKAAMGMRAVAYCVSIKHSRHMAEAFNAAGIPAAHLDGDTDDLERARVIRDFADGKYLILCNQALFTEGFDLASVAQKDVTIDCVIDLAPTQSLSLYMQKVGRALRPAHGKVAVILDHAGNMLRHGLPDADRDWTLDGRKKNGRRSANDNEPDVPVRTCPECFAITKPVPICPNCGHEYQLKERKIEEKDGHLVELSKGDMEAIRQQQMQQQRREQGRAQTVEQLMATLGYSRGRAEKVLKAREEKAELQANVRTALAEWHEKHRQSIKNTFGIFTNDIPRMKPKELRQLLEKINSYGQDMPANDNCGFSISEVA